MALSESEFWDLGFREFEALRKQHREYLRRWASEMALQANIWRKEGAVPFTAEDFLGESNHAKRQVEREAEARAVMLANAQLARIVEGAPAGDDVPDWAKEGYGVN